MPLPRTWRDLLLVGILIGVPTISLVVDTFSHSNTTNTPTPTIARTTNPFADITVRAEGAYVWDIKNQKVLFQKNGSEILPLASLTKLMTSVVATEATNASTSITFKKDYLAPEGDSGLVVGEVWDIKKLIEFTLVSSSNDGAYALASTVEATTPQQGDFVSQMNSKSRSLGFNTLSFNNPTGLDVDTEKAGGYGSAQDIAKLCEYILKNHPDIFSSTNKDKVMVASNSTIHTAINTDSAVDYIPGLIASKTGTTDLSGGNLAIVIDVGIQHPVAIVVLGSTPDERFTDIQKLTDSTFQYIALEK